MASYYVYSGAAGAGTGADWANAFTTLSAAFTGRAAGDIFYVADDHAESTAATLTLTSPGTAASPCQVICVRRSGGSVPPVSADLRTTASVTVTGANTLALAGNAYCYGIQFTAGSGSSSGIISVFSNSSWYRFDSCALRMGGTGTGGRMNLGATQCGVVLKNTTLHFAHASQGVIPGGHLVWLDTSSAVTGTVPTVLFLNGTAQCLVEMQGVDLSALGSGFSLFNTSNNRYCVVRLTDCKLGSSVTPTTGSLTGIDGPMLHLVNCDSADTNYRYYKQTYQGTITHETTIVRTSGASDGTTTFSRKMVTTANSKFYSPLESDPCAIWNETTGSSITVTIPVVTDNVTLTDADAWVEVEYLGTSGFPLGNYASDRAADILTTGTNQTTDNSSTWTTTGLGTPVKQSFSVSFTPQEKGWVKAKVILARPSTTLYFDPPAALS